VYFVSDFSNLDFSSVLKDPQNAHYFIHCHPLRSDYNLMDLMVNEMVGSLGIFLAIVTVDPSHGVLEFLRHHVGLQNLIDALEPKAHVGQRLSAQRTRIVVS